MARQSIGLKLPHNIDQLWTDTAKHMGLSKTSAFIVAVRNLAEKEGVKERPLEPKEEKAEA